MGRFAIDAGEKNHSEGARRARMWPRERMLWCWDLTFLTQRPRFRYQIIHVMLRRESRRINKKRVHRLYRLDGLQ